VERRLVFKSAHIEHFLFYIYRRTNRKGEKIMIAVTHQTFGLTFGLIAILLLQIFGIKPEGLVDSTFYYFLVLLGSLLPDIDTYNSKLGRKVPLLSVLIKVIFGHRGITHSLLFVALVGIVSSLLLANFSWLFVLGLTLGTLSHITGDFLTKSGVPLLAPFTNKRFRAPITFATRTFPEFLVCGFLVILNVGLLYLLYFI
jgi:inner membrane protein